MSGGRRGAWKPALMVSCVLRLLKSLVYAPPINSQSTKVLSLHATEGGRHTTFGHPQEAKVGSCSTDIVSDKGAVLGILRCRWLCSPSTVVIMMCSATLRPHCKQPFTLNYKVRPNKKCLLLLVKIVRAGAAFSSSIGMMAQFWRIETH